MGFFSFIGKAVKGVAHVVGSVAKVAAPLALGGPLGAVGAKLGGSLLGSLLHSKSPMSATPLKINIAGTNRSIPILRAKPGGMMSTPRIAAASPVMPGGSIATARGIMAPGGGVPPSTYGGSHGTGRKRKRRSKSSRRSSHARSSRKHSGGRRKGKLKFGSAAYRRKYLGHR